MRHKFDLRNNYFAGAQHDDEQFAKDMTARAGALEPFIEDEKPWICPACRAGNHICKLEVVRILKGEPAPCECNHCAARPFTTLDHITRLRTEWAAADPSSEKSQQLHGTWAQIWAVN